MLDGIIFRYDIAEYESFIFQSEFYAILLVSFVLCLSMLKISLSGFVLIGHPLTIRDENNFGHISIFNFGFVRFKCAKYKN